MKFERRIEVRPHKATDGELIRLEKQQGFSLDPQHKAFFRSRDGNLRVFRISPAIKEVGD